MDQSSFYVTLPSASMDIFPKNTIADFTINLNKPMNLQRKMGSLFSSDSVSLYFG